MEKYGLPVENEKFQLLSENTEMLSSIYFLIVTITVFVSSYFFLKIINNRSWLFTIKKGGSVKSADKDILKDVLSQINLTLACY